MRLLSTPTTQTRWAPCPVGGRWVMSVVDGGSAPAPQKVGSNPAGVAPAPAEATGGMGALAERFVKAFRADRELQRRLQVVISEIRDGPANITDLTLYMLQNWMKDAKKTNPEEYKRLQELHNALVFLRDQYGVEAITKSVVREVTIRGQRKLRTVKEVRFRDGSVAWLVFFRIMAMQYYTVYYRGFSECHRRDYWENPKWRELKHRIHYTELHRKRCMRTVYFNRYYAYILQCVTLPEVGA